MTRRLILQALMLGAIGFLLTLTGCTTVETRISERPEAFRRMSPTDQALVQQGRVRDGMSRDAVYIAWGPPSQRVPGRNRGHVVETWIYEGTSAGDYLGPFYYGAPYGYGLGYGYWGGGRYGRLRRGHYYYDPFYDPFFYNHANIVRYPERLVSFEGDRAIAFQFLPAPRFL